MTYRALIVCNSIYPDDPKGLPELKGPQVDGMHLWRALTDSSTGYFSTQDISVMFERSGKEVLTRSEDFFRTAESEDILLYYFSGHGKRGRSQFYICVRDTTSTHLVSTGLSATSLNEMMDASAAAAIIVVLDCCYGGAFKGDEIAAEFEGSGRYVVAASGPSEPAKDAEKLGEASPFTHAFCEVIVAGSMPGRASLSIDEVVRATSQALRSSGLLPHQRFASSGTIPLAGSRNDLEAAGRKGTDAPSGSSKEPATRQLIHPVNQGETPKEILSWIGIRKRNRGDLTVGDVRGWLTCLTLALAASSSGYIAWLGWPDYQDPFGNHAGQDRHRYILIPMIGASLIIAALASVEGVLSLRVSSSLKSHRPASRRVIVSVANQHGLREVKLIRMAVALLAGPLVFAGFVGFENFSFPYVLSMAAIGGLALASLANLVVRRGSDCLLAGALLLLAAEVVPVYVNDGITPAFLTTPGEALAVSAGAVIICWALRFSALATISWTSLALPIVLLPGYNVHAVVAPVVALTGCMLIALALAIGEARQVDIFPSHKGVRVDFVGPG